ERPARRRARARRARARASEGAASTARSSVLRSSSPMTVKPSTRSYAPHMQRIGRYEVVSTLGQGGMGAVYEVRAAGGGESLALNLLPDSTPELRSRFLRETGILSFLSRHPHVVPYRDAGEDRGRPFVVMALLRGGTLESALARESIPRD